MEPGAARVSPFLTEPASPESSRAARFPASSRSAPTPWRWSSRTRTVPGPGYSASTSPGDTCPADTVPAATVPRPGREKRRSTSSRKGRSTLRLRGGRAAMARRRASSPSPVLAETGRMGAPSRKVPAVRAAQSAFTRARRPSSARSALVMATMPRSMPSRAHRARCSLVWGMIPSPASTVRSTPSAPAAPASMPRMNLSWPGTSTRSASPPSGRGRTAKPGSMVRPRRFSSGRVSVSVPVRAFTRAVFPWSTWPATARIRRFTGSSPLPLPPPGEFPPHPPPPGCARPAGGRRGGCGRGWAPHGGGRRPPAPRGRPARR